jgi:hypothetical protein
MRVEWSASRSSRSLAPGKGTPVPIVQEAWWAPEPVWTQRLQDKSFRLCRGSNVEHPVVYPVARHYTAWATPADLAASDDVNKLSRRKADCNSICSQNGIFTVALSLSIVMQDKYLPVSCAVMLCRGCLHSCARLTSIIISIWKCRRVHVTAVKQISSRPVLVVEETCLQFSTFACRIAAKRWAGIRECFPEVSSVSVD